MQKLANSFFFVVFSVHNYILFCDFIAPKAWCEAKILWANKCFLKLFCVRSSFFPSKMKFERIKWWTLLQKKKMRRKKNNIFLKPFFSCVCWNHKCVGLHFAYVHFIPLFCVFGACFGSIFFTIDFIESAQAIWNENCSIYKLSFERRFTMECFG